MIINFDEMTATVNPHFKGGEGEYVVKSFQDGQNKIMHGVLEPGSSIGMHEHVVNSEVYHILQGKAKVVMGDGSEEHLLAGQTHYCPMGNSHCLINDGDTTLVFLGIVGEHHS